MLCEKLLEHELGDLEGYDPLAHWHYLEVVLAALSGGVLVEGCGAPYAAFVGGDANADAWSTYKDAPVLGL